MKDFIDRIKMSSEYERNFKKEPLFFKVFIIFVWIFEFVGKGIFCILCFLTVPIWIVPYTIWWCQTNKTRSEE